MSLYDTQSLHDFLTQTPESGLRKILVDRQRMTDVHFNLLLKVARASSGAQFGELFEKKELPRLRLSPAETKIREKFWDDCVTVLNERGLLQPPTAPKIAA